MRTFFIILSCLLFGGWTLWARHHYTCNIMQLCGDPPPAISEAGRTMDLAFNVNEKPVLSGYEQFAYDLSGVDPELTENNNKFVQDVAKFLEENDDVKLKVSGKYLSSETYEGIVETIGLARAGKIKEMLVGMGIKKDRISIDSDVLEGVDSLAVPLSFAGTGKTLADIAAEKNKIASAEDAKKKAEEKAKEDAKEKLVDARFEFSNMTFSDLSFAVGSDKFVPVKNFINYADSVSRYLVAHPDKKVTVIGHTDSDGTDDSNYDLGLRRAKNVKTYLTRSHKISQGKILTKSAGEKEPVAPNTTDANKSKNRRVNVQIN